MQFLLDTNMCVFFLRGKLNLDDLIRQKGRENCFIPEITVAELRYGAENSDNPTKSHKAVDAFVGGLSIVPIYGSIKWYAKEKVRLRKIGKPIQDEFDLLIGCYSNREQTDFGNRQWKRFWTIGQNKNC